MLAGMNAPSIDPRFNPLTGRLLKARELVLRRFPLADSPLRIVALTPGPFGGLQAGLVSTVEAEDSQ